MHKIIPHSKPEITNGDIDNVIGVLSSKFVGRGSITQQANESVKKYLNQSHAWIVNSGSSALFLALKALDIQHGDEIIVSVYGCPSLLNQIINVGAKPVIIDTYESSFFINSETVKKSITSCTKAILFFHPFGYFDDSIISLKLLGIPVIEDITHAFNAEFNSQKAGSYGDIVISSLGSTKYITSGTGGIITTNNNTLAQRIACLLDYDYEQNVYEDGPERYNLLIGDINTALLLSQLNRIDTIVDRRRMIAVLYQKNIPIYFSHPQFDGSAHFRFFLRIPVNRIVKYKEQLMSKGIICHIGGLKLISDVLNNADAFPFSSSLHQQLLSIPIYPSLLTEEIEYIIKSVNSLSEK